MASNYDSIDIWWTEDGDFKISDSGDIEGTEVDQIEALKQKVMDMLVSDTGDWLGYPTLAANLADFVGEANTRENAKKIEERVKKVLVNGDIVSKSDIEVSVGAINIDMVAINIIVHALPTMRNSLKREMVMTFFFASSDGHIEWSNGQSGEV